MAELPSSVAIQVRHASLCVAHLSLSLADKLGRVRNAQFVPWYPGLDQYWGHGIQESFFRRLSEINDLPSSTSSIANGKSFSRRDLSTNPRAPWASPARTSSSSS